MRTCVRAIERTLRSMQFIHRVLKLDYIRQYLSGFQKNDRLDYSGTLRGGHVMGGRSPRFTFEAVTLKAVGAHVRHV